MLVIGGAALGAAVIALIMVLNRGGTPDKPAKLAAASPPPSSGAKPPAVEPPAPTPAPPEPAPPEPTPPEPPTGPIAPAPSTPTTTPVVTRPANPIRPGKTVATATDPTTAKPAIDGSTLANTRTAYNTGNQRLFAGDTAGAITAYRQALALSPGYAAGYRGLGLAYAQQGDKAKALQAFKTYLSAAPGAKDVALIQKRIATLQGK